MLFDLRGRRRRGIQAIYLLLAILMGGGLVLFGIGGDVQGGLVDAFQQNNGDATEQIEKRVDDAEAAARRNPRDARAWAVLAESRYQLAGQSKGFNEQTGEFAGESRNQLVQAERAWDRHLQVAGDRPNSDLAGTMQIAFQALGKPEKAVRAQEIVLEARGDAAGFGDYARLAELAYIAKQTRKGDLAAERAKSLAKDQPKERRDALAQSLDAAKAQAAGAEAGRQAAPGAPEIPPGATTTVPAGGG